jgi:hypothetical protein
MIFRPVASWQRVKWKAADEKIGELKEKYGTGKRNRKHFQM